MSGKKPKRSMDEALSKSAEALAFLEEGKPRRADRPVRTPKLDQQPGYRHSEQAVRDRPRPVPGKRPVESVRMTFRLPKSIADGLIDASAGRRKRRDKASSQQDIVAEALDLWLKRTN